MSAAIITGSAGLVGSEAVAYFASLGMDVVGIDNGMRVNFSARKLQQTASAIVSARKSQLTIITMWTSATPMQFHASSISTDATSP
jgi:nucleoside-diphosphate-sugar epimerase